MSILATIGLIAVVWALNRGWRRDATDSPDGPRSGMLLYTDHGTGLQYLAAGPLGSLTPRLDADGKHMRAGPQAEDER